MRQLKYAIDSIIRKPIKMFFVIVQVVIATIVLCNAISITLKTVDTVKGATNLYSNKNMYRLMDTTSISKSDKIQDDEFLEKKQYELYKFFSNNEKFKIYAQCGTNLMIKDFCDDDKFCYDISNKYIINPYKNINGKFTSVNGFYIDYEYNKQNKLVTEKGRGFKKEDFIPSDEMSVILGAGYEGIYDVGDEFNYFDFFNLKEKKIKVVGILKENTYAFDGGQIGCIDDNVICPMETISEEYKNVSSMFPWWLSQAIVETGNSKDTIKKINEKSLELDLYNFKLSSCQEEIKNNIKELQKSSVLAILISVVIFLFISIGMINVQLNMIDEKRTEYGVHLLSGAQKRDIIICNYITISLYFFIGMVIGWYLYTFNLLESCDIRIFIFTFILYIMIIILVSVIPSGKIKKMQVNNLIRDLSE